MKKALILFLSLVLIGASYFWVFNFCTDTNERSVAIFYAMAMTDSESFFETIRCHPEIFDGSWERTTRRMGEKLIKKAFKAVPSSIDQERIFTVAGEAGHPELGRKVYEGMMNNAVDLKRTGEAILSMPAIVEGIKRGDTTVYDQSIFRVSNFVLEQARYVMSPREWEELKAISRISNFCWVRLAM